MPMQYELEIRGAKCLEYHHQSFPDALPPIAADARATIWAVDQVKEFLTKNGNGSTLVTATLAKRKEDDFGGEWKLCFRTTESASEWQSRNGGDH